MAVASFDNEFNCRSRRLMTSQLRVTMVRAVALQHSNGRCGDRAPIGRLVDSFDPIGQVYVLWLITLYTNSIVMGIALYPFPYLFWVTT